jgi:hypothetical protein
MSQGVPRSLIVFGVVAVAGFELIRAFPDLLLIPQRLAGQTGEYQGKAQQGDLVAAQTAKTRAEAELAQTQAKLAQTQAKLAESQAGLAQSQATNTNLDSVNKTIGIAAVGALIYGGVKAYQAITSDDNGQQSAASRSPQQQAQAPTNSPLRYATVTALGLNLRSGPGATYQSLLTMSQGTRVTVVREADNGWLEIDATGQDGAPIHGFANGKLLSMAQ